MLGQELAKQQRHGRILLVGGAVMLLIIGNRNSTRDIDASFEDEGPAIRKAVGEIAKRERLPSDWINDGAKGFFYSSPPINLWKSYPGVDIYIPEMEYLLAMKIVAGRPQDIGDAQALIHYLGISQAEDVLNILKKYIPSRYLTPRLQYMVDDWFD